MEQMEQSNTHRGQVTLTIPSWILAVTKVVDYGASAVKSTTEIAQETVSKRPSLPKFSFNFNKDKFPKVGSKISGFVKSHKKVVAALLAVVVIAGFSFIMIRNNGSDLSATADSSGAVLSGQQVSINRRFEIPIKTKEGEETGEKLVVTIANMEKSKQILIQGKPARAKEGKAFLIINMEVENSTKKQLTVKPIDMVRMVTPDDKRLAADVHNNEVSSEPVSIKKTRIGYVINESDNSFRFLIGEVRGTQEPIEVTF